MQTRPRTLAVGTALPMTPLEHAFLSPGLTAAPGAGVLFSRLDATNTAPGVISDLGERIYNDTAARFDLVRGQLVQASWLDRGPGKESVITLAFHHLSADVTSLAVVMLALEQAYKNPDHMQDAPSPSL